MRSMRFLVMLVALAAAPGALAALAVVEGVQYPAWLDRGGQTVPLTPGTPLRPKDKLRTGDNARVLLRMGEGSAVKLGENAQFVFDRADDRGVFSATLAVLAGAFRFTTDSLRKAQRRDIAIQVKNVTAGIRGTDVWGKSTRERDLVCLLEGNVSVGSEGHPTVTLDTPLDFYQKPRDAAPSVAKVDAKQIAEWSLETEMSKEGAAARTGGAWRVSAAAFRTRDEALAMNRRLRAGGYPAEVSEREGIYSVRIGGLAGESEARALIQQLRAVPGISMPVVQSPGT
jgi:cell division septation protein DedD